MNQHDNTAEAAVVKKSPKFSSVWALPVLASLIGLWLVIQAILTAGIDITIRFDSANGIIIGKTEVRYKGLIVGVVKDIALDESLETVTVTVEMNHKTAPYLNENSVFWLVSPEVSLSKISGLDTVIGGNYIAMKPGDGKSKREFVALEKAAPIAENAPGLHLTLESETLGTISLGSLVYYKKVAVGEVVDYSLNLDTDTIEINLLIDEQYAHLVNNNSRFYNASGISIEGDLSGFRLQTESLGAIVAGGIAFFTPEDSVTESTEPVRTNFRLYESYHDARAMLEVVMHFKAIDRIKVDKTKIKIFNHEVGYIASFKYKSSDKANWTAIAYFDPKIEPFLTDSAQFWLETPGISMTQVDSFSDILGGAYIAFEAGEVGDPPLFEFSVGEKRPQLDFEKPGLHLLLTAEDLSSVNVDEPIYYRNLQVGKVESFQLAENNKSFNVHVNIDEEYEYLVNKDTIFYENSGIEVKGTLRSFSVTSKPLQALVTGGITLHSSEINTEDRLDDGSVFRLFRTLKDGRYTETVKVKVKSDDDISADITRLMYLGDEIGLVSAVEISNTDQSVTVSIKYNPLFKDLFRQDSAIWMVKPKITAGSIVGLDALVSGAYFAIKPGVGAPADSFILADNPPASRADDPGLQIVLTSDEAGSVSVGAPITYLQREIGVVETVEFNESDMNIRILATIDEQYRQHIRSTSRFYVGSGIHMQGSVANLNVRTESLASIMRGGLALFNDADDAGVEAEELQQYALFNSRQDAMLNGHEITLHFDRVVDLAPGALIKYGEHSVGTVNKVAISADLSQTTVTAHVAKKYRSLYADDAKYWLASASIGIAKVDNPQALLSGNFIGVIPGQGADATNFVGHYRKPPTKRLSSGLNIQLYASRLGSLKAGNPVYYRQILVGEVLGHELSDDDNSVLIYANIDAQYQHLVNNKSRFWNASGINVEAGVFSGVDISTESVETILSGGIAFATPAEGEAVVDGKIAFPLYDKPKNEWLQWKINQ